MLAVDSVLAGDSVLAVGVFRDEHGRTDGRTDNRILGLGLEYVQIPIPCGYFRGYWRSNNVKIIGSVIVNNYGLSLTQKLDSLPSNHDYRLFLRSSSFL